MGIASGRRIGGPSPLANQVAVVTGASSGIGKALSLALAGKGCKVGLLARRVDLLEGLAKDIEKTSRTAAVAVADVADRQQTIRAIEELRSRLGPIDLLIANAGVGFPTFLNPVNTADVETTFRVNVLGMVYSIEAVLPEMLSRKHGHLAAVSSLASYQGLPGESAYCASKAAVNAYMEGLRIQLHNRGIAVTTVCPGFVRTPMTAPNKFHMPFLLEADDAAKRIVRALERRAKVYNFPWQLNLLMTLTRWLPDWLVARTMKSYNEDPPIVERR